MTPSAPLTAGELPEHGLYAGRGEGLLDTLQFERPAYLFDPRRVKNSALGAFTYVNGLHTTSLYDCTLGRYCSIAEAVVIGPYEHPIEGLSQHVFMFSGPEQFPGFFRFPEFKALAVEQSRTVPANERLTVIGHDVWVGAGAFIKRGITVGNGAIIGAHAVVTRDVPPYAIVAGQPAKVLRMRFDAHTVERLQALQWWLYDLAPHKQAIDFSRIDEALDGLEARLADGRLQPFEPISYSLTTVKGGFTIEPMPAPLYSALARSTAAAPPSDHALP